MALIEMDFANGGGGTPTVVSGTATTTPTVVCTSENFTALTGENGIYVVSAMVVENGSIVWQLIDNSCPITYNTTTHEISVSWNGTYLRHDYIVQYV